MSGRVCPELLLGDEDMPVSEPDPAAGCGECRSTDEAPAVHRLRVVPGGQKPVPADQGKPTTSPQRADDAPVLMLRYRAGIVGETRRTVHAVPLLARRSAEGMLTALCGAILSPAELEIVAFREGMPCMAGVFRLVTDTATQVVDRRVGGRGSGGEGTGDAREFSPPHPPAHFPSTPAHAARLAGWCSLQRRSITSRRWPVVGTLAGLGGALRSPAPAGRTFIHPRHCASVEEIVVAEVEVPASRFPHPHQQLRIVTRSEREVAKGGRYVFARGGHELDRRPEGSLRDYVGLCWVCIDEVTKL